jgi:hypothetical protein
MDLNSFVFWALFIYIFLLKCWDLKKYIQKDNFILIFKVIIYSLLKNVWKTMKTLFFLLEPTSRNHYYYYKYLFNLHQKTLKNIFKCFNDALPPN